MSDLISREALLAAYDAAHKGPPGGARKLIEEAPGIDAAPVVHGAWVPLDDDPPEDFECNVCGYVSTASFDCSGITPNKFPYCPMCGARMDGGDDDD